MTNEQLDAIRARYADKPLLRELRTDTLGNFITVTREHPVLTLLDEVERLRDAHAMAVQVSGELCEKCGWAMKFPGEKCRCELLAEVERLTVEREESEHQMHLRIRAGYDKTVADSWRAWAEKQSEAAFSRGVAAMREAAAKRCEVSPFFDKVTTVGLEYADAVRALPDPEDTE